MRNLRNTETELLPSTETLYNTSSELTPQETKKQSHLFNTLHRTAPHSSVQMIQHLFISRFTFWLHTVEWCGKKAAKLFFILFCFLNVLSHWDSYISQTESSSDRHVSSLEFVYYLKTEELPAEVRLVSNTLWITLSTYFSLHVAEDSWELPSKTNKRLTRKVVGRNCVRK